MAEAQATEQPRDLTQLINLTHVVYGLLAASLVLGGIPAIVGIIINYVKLDETRGTWIESHFRWQIRTFWFGLLWAVVGFLLLFILIGWVILVAGGIWVIYRIVKGWLNLNEKKPMITSPSAPAV